MHAVARWSPVPGGSASVYSRVHRASRPAPNGMAPGTPQWRTRCIRNELLRRREFLYAALGPGRDSRAGLRDLMANECSARSRGAGSDRGRLGQVAGSGGREGLDIVTAGARRLDNFGLTGMRLRRAPDLLTRHRRATRRFVPARIIAHLSKTTCVEFSLKSLLFDFASRIAFSDVRVQPGDFGALRGLAARFLASDFKGATTSGQGKREEQEQRWAVHGRDCGMGWGRGRHRAARGAPFRRLRGRLVQRTSMSSRSFALPASRPAVARSERIKRTSA